MSRDRQNVIGGASAVAAGPLEPLLTPSEIAKYLKIDVSTARRLFIDRADVIKIGHDSSVRRGKRSYVTLRIPLSSLYRFLGERKG